MRSSVVIREHFGGFVVLSSAHPISECARAVDIDPTERAAHARSSRTAAAATIDLDAARQAPELEAVAHARAAAKLPAFVRLPRARAPE